MLPVDHVVSESTVGAPETVDTVNVPESMMALDIGPATLNLYRDKLQGAKTVLWNGPMGLFENKDFAKGTFEVARAISELDGCFSLVGGGDSVSAINTLLSNFTRNTR